METFSRSNIIGTLFTLAALTFFPLDFAHASDTSRTNFSLGIDVGGGYQSFSPSGGYDAVSGGLVNGRAVFELENLDFGNLSTGLGVQETWQRGSTSSSFESFFGRLPIWDLGYSHQLLGDRLFVGALIRNEFGPGALFNLSQLSVFQWLIALGPQLEYRWPLVLFGQEAKVIFNVAGLYGATGGSKALWQIPGSVGLRFSLGSHSETEKPNPLPVPVLQEAPSPVAVPEATETPSRPPASISNETPTSSPTPAASDTSEESIAQVVPEGLTITIPTSRVRFKINKATVGVAAMKYLKALAKLLVDHSKEWDKLDISGHTDRRGTESFNCALSQRRARLFSRMIEGLGMEKERVHAYGLGSSKPIDLRDNRAGWTRNRRIEIKVYSHEKGAEALVKAANELDRMLLSAPNPSPTPVPQNTSEEDIAQIVPDGLRITIPTSRVRFKINKATVGAAAMNYLKALAKLLVDHSKEWGKLDISGHTDRRGTESFNCALSQRRARLFSRMIEGLGMEKERVHAYGLGSSKPIDLRDNRAGWTRNRRIEIKVYAGEKNAQALVKAINELGRKLQSYLIQSSEPDLEVGETEPVGTVPN